MRALLICASFLLLASSAAFAQKPPNLTGEWKLDVAKSNYGNFPKPQSMTRRIAHADPLLVMSTTQVGAQGEVTSQLTYTTDGKTVTNKDSTGTAVWKGQQLVIESSREYQGAFLKQKDLWTISPDVKTILVETHVSLPNGEFDVKQTFVKQ
jgi:hypothetical protein